MRDERVAPFALLLCLEGAYTHEGEGAGNINRNRARRGALNSVSVATHAARGGALSRSPIETPARRIAPCRDPGRPGREWARSCSREASWQGSEGLPGGPNPARFSTRCWGQLGRPHSPFERWGISHSFVRSKGPQGRGTKLCEIPHFGRTKPVCSEPYTQVLVRCGPL